MLSRLERLERRVVERVQEDEDRIPAWLRPGRGEHRWQMGLAVALAIGLQVSLPAKLTLRPHYLLPALEGGVLLALFVTGPVRIDRTSSLLRGTAIALIGLLSLDNAVSAALLIHVIVLGKADTAGRLLVEGVAIWCTNVIVFALWYWELDRGGPAARANAVSKYPDLLFPQMQQPSLAPPEWRPAFFDYLYTSFTNAAAFSPTDTMPLSKWVKLLFLCQSAVSLATVALVIARAVNIFKGG